MIAKGNLHANGKKLAAYMTTGKDDERAELAELRGFASESIFEAFTDVQIQAGGTHCQKPFFHSYVRLPEGEALDREKWLHVADRIEKKLGFEEQPRAVAFHIKENGETHMHMAWSRIDTENMRAIDPGLYKNKLKEVSRELEKELGLTNVRNERDPKDKTKSPSRDEFEQSRRLKTNVKEIRANIRDCWDESATGKEFRERLKEYDYLLARGDRRDFVVVDHAGGDHALSKRITEATAKEMRDRLSDLQHAALPTVEDAKLRQQEKIEQRAVEQTHLSEDTKEFLAPPVGTAEREDETNRPTRMEGISEFIRESWDASATGKEFELKIFKERGYALAHDAQQGFFVVARDASAHALSKKISCTTEQEMKDRLSDLDLTSLAGVEEAKGWMFEDLAEGGYEPWRGGDDYIENFKVPPVAAAEREDELLDPVPGGLNERPEARDGPAPLYVAHHEKQDSPELLTAHVNGLLASFASIKISREPKASDFLNDPAALREYYTHLGAERARKKALDRIDDDIKAGKNLDASDVRRLSREDLENIKEYGDDAMQDMIRAREKERSREADGGRERER